MANIQPNTVIHLLKDVPLDNTYTDTMYWETANHQHDNFFSLRKYTFTQQTYQRVNKNKLRIQRCADDIYDCNYLMFQNTAFGNKWFYAFITSVEYINNITSEIVYEIDDMQTWLFDYTLRPCFVEREHIANDEITNMDLIKPEPISADYIIKYDTGYLEQLDYTVLVSYLASVDDPTNTHVIGNQMYNGCEYKTYKMPEDSANLSHFLRTMKQLLLEDNVLALTCVPTLCAEAGTGVTTHYNRVTRPLTNGGYTPRNKKLLFYPYSFLSVDTGTSARDYRYELFLESSDPQFAICGYQTDNPSIAIYPIMYNNRRNETRINPSEKIVMNGFPRMSWRKDGYVNTLLSSQLPAMQMQGAAKTAEVAVALNALTPNLVGNGMGDYNNSNLGGSNASDVDLAKNIKHIYYNLCGVTEERAKQIDSYFDRYGYACEEIKVPNRNVREHWTYCKTRDCNIIGSIPVESMSNIKKIYNKGITWWDAFGNVGNYLLSNRTLEEIANE